MWLLLIHLYGGAYPEIKAAWLLCPSGASNACFGDFQADLLKENHLGPMAFELFFLTGTPKSIDIQPFLPWDRSNRDIGPNLQGGGAHLMPQNPEKSKAAFWSWPTILIFSLTGQITHIYTATLLLGMYFSPDPIFLAHSAHLFFAFHARNPAHCLSVIQTDTAVCCRSPRSLPMGDPRSSIAWGPFAAASRCHAHPRHKPATLHFRQ